ncbi:MAG: tetratricopeptide repeat protein [Candidatus Odinarchaeota archaeon]
MKTTDYSLKEAEKMIYVEGKGLEPLSLLEELEEDTSLDEKERLQVKILKCHALHRNAGSRLERLEEARKLAREAYAAVLELEQSVLFVDALIVKLLGVWFEEDQHAELLRGIEKARNILQSYDQLSSYREGYLMYYKGEIHLYRDENEMVLRCYQKALAIFEELEIKFMISRVLWRLGNYYDAGEGDKAKSLPYFHKSLAIAEELDIKTYMGWPCLSIGYYYHDFQGDLDQAMHYYQKSLESWTDAGNYSAWRPMSEIGRLYLSKGQLEPALEYALKSLQITREALGNDPRNASHRRCTMITSMIVGQVYHALGNYDKALEHYQLGLEMAKELLSEQKERGPPTHSFVSRFLYFLFSLHLERDHVEVARGYLQQMKELAENTEQHPAKSQRRVTSLHYRLGKARILKNSSRFVDKAKSQAILQDLVAEEVILYQFTFEAMLYLCELLFEELKLSGDEIILEETKGLSKKIHEIGQKYHAYPAIVNALILQAKLAILEADIDGATQRLARAAQLAEERDLVLLQKKVKQEQIDLDEQLEQWKELYERNAPLYERITHARFAKYFKEAQKMIEMMK